MGSHNCFGNTCRPSRRSISTIPGIPRVINEVYTTDPYIPFTRSWNPDVARITFPFSSKLRFTNKIPTEYGGFVYRDCLARGIYRDSERALFRMRSRSFNRHKIHRKCVSIIRQLAWKTCKFYIYTLKSTFDINSWICILADSTLLSRLRLSRNCLRNHQPRINYYKIAMYILIDAPIFLIAQPRNMSIGEGERERRWSLFIAL